MIKMQYIFKNFTQNYHFPTQLSVPDNIMLVLIDSLSFTCKVPS